MLSIDKLDHHTLVGASSSLARILYENVKQGASIGFIEPFSLDDSKRYWLENVAKNIAGNKAILFVARYKENVIGCVQLIVQMPANQSHRVEIAKLLVHPNNQRRGVAYKLLQTVEEEARLLKKSLIVLDTKTGDNAQRLYLKTGFIEAGSIPNFALNPDNDGLAATTIMYKLLI
jgi:ribosomal protein S18 acetylase RimI-like enzyme